LMLLGNKQKGLISSKRSAGLQHLSLRPLIFKFSDYFHRQKKNWENNLINWGRKQTSRPRPFMCVWVATRCFFVVDWTSSILIFSISL
jgi:hypothetical protein